jgi:Bifunctional DNA primase/polymerase, N-terminal
MSPQSQNPTGAQPQTGATPTMLEAALEYARNGIPVFPCNPLDKKPLTPNGFYDATTDEAQITAWWTQWPNAMIAAPTGARSNMWVLDTDVDPIKKIDGEATLAQFTAQHGELPKTLTAFTPRGGKHRVFTWDRSAATEIRNSAGRIGPGIDVRGEGGYVILAPSRTADGGVYRWDPDTDQAVAAPEWLIKLACSKKASAWARAALDRECKAVESAQPGTRNNTLNTAAFNLFQIVGGGGLDEQEVRDRLFEAARACGLVADDGAQAVWATINSAAQAGKAQPRTRPQPQPQRTGPRPIIQIIAGQLPRIVRETEDALVTSGLPIFSRAGSLVQPVSEIMSAAGGRKTVVARLRAFCPDSFLGPVAESAEFQHYNRKRNAWVEIDPPLQLVRMVLVGERHWPFPRVAGIITTPTLRPDGSLLADPGYDPESELYLLPGFQLPEIPEHPTEQDARAALKTLTDLLTEFSFKAERGEHEKRLNRSIALSGLLTAQVRGSLPTAPVHLIVADTSGTGKSYYVDLVAVIATGRLCPVITALKNMEETEKRIGSVLLSGMPIVSLDNCTHDLSGELLCQLAERPVIKIRILGRSEMPDCEVHTAVFATGNNIAFKGDMVRRGFVCHLEALEERPELRTFHQDALKQVAADRGRYVAAGLTIIRAYLAAGVPRVCGPFGSYPEWSTMVRSPLVWLGEPDPVSSMDASRAEDPELSDIRELFGLWLSYGIDLDTPYTTTRFVEEACKPPTGFNSPWFKQFLVRVAGDKDGNVSAKRLGEWLRRISGRVVSVPADDGTVGKYRLIRGQAGAGRASFCLKKVG